jgi:flagellar hook-length control protein FliK
MDQEGFLGVPSQARQMSVAQGIGAVAGDGTETARHAAQQIETAVFKGNSKTTEIALNPEELGRVRLTLTAINGALTLVSLDRSARNPRTFAPSYRCSGPRI